MKPTAHLAVALIGVIPMLFVLRLVRRRSLRAKYALLWIGVGVGVAFVAIAPGVLDHVSSWLGISYPPAVYLMIAIVFLLLVAVHFSWELSRLEDRTRTLAEELALLRATEPEQRAEVAGP